MKIYKTKEQFFEMSTASRKKMLCEMFTSEFGGVIEHINTNRNAIRHPIFGKVHVQIQQGKPFVTNKTNPNADWADDFDMDLYVFPGSGKNSVSVALLDLSNPDIRALYHSKTTALDLISNAIRIFTIETE